jgi:hypothetical protein
MLSGPVAAVSDGTMQMDAVDPKAAAEVEGATSEFAKVDGYASLPARASKFSRICDELVTDFPRQMLHRPCYPFTDAPTPAIDYCYRETTTSLHIWCR